MSDLVIGYDHGFGHGRKGSEPMLRSLAREMGFGLSVVDAVAVDGETVSSSRIRKFVGNADFRYVKHALGRRYSLTAGVIPGEGRGRTIGFPTANLKVPGRGKLLPPDGVYAVLVRVNGKACPGMMHQGERPTFAGAAPSLEVHLIDFEGDLAGEILDVEYVAWIRSIKRFPGPEQLRARLARDRRGAIRGGERTLHLTNSLFP